MDNRKLLALAAAATVGAVAALAAIAHRLDPHIRWRTKSGPVFVYTRRTQAGEPLRVMMAGDVYQSATYLDQRWNELPFEYYRAFDRMFQSPAEIKQVLMLGGGGFAYPKHLLTTNEQVHIDVVESDIEVIGLALDYFYLDRLMEAFPDRLGVHEEDAMRYLQATEDTYDAIINDAFRGATPDSGLASPDGVHLVHSKLNPGGLYLVNVVAYPQSEGAYADLTKLCSTLERSFEHVWVIPSTDEEFSEEENYLVVASDAECDFPDAIPH